MKLIDIIIFSLCVIGLVYFIFDRRKYTNLSAYYEKHERLFEIIKEITALENDNKEFNELIKITNLDTDVDDEFADKLICYRNNEDKLKFLKNEQIKIEYYIKNARMYNDIWDMGIKY